MNTVGQKFTHDLADIYDAEHRFLEAQNDMYAKATSPMLKEMISEHITQTRQQIQNIDQIYGIIGVAPLRGNCAAAAGLVVEGDAMMRNADMSNQLLDTIITTAAGKVEHYEIASYRNLIATADRFSQPRIIDLLRSNLEQEERTAAKLEESYGHLLEYAVSTQKLQTALGERAPIF
jgi:ferritin-like metal-binding protein YciE